MKLLLIDVDSTIPNLALMKISAYNKKYGHSVFLNRGCHNPDKVKISCVFEWNKTQVSGIAKMFNCEVEIGGYGINEVHLIPEIEHIMPDYDLYGIDYSMGFTTRGCIRRCPFCGVWKREGKLHEHAPITEFWDLHHKKLVLLDNNFLASHLWREKIEFIITNRLAVNFNQGLDIRLIDNEKAKWLSKLDYRTFTFKTKMLHFAFDDLSMENQVRAGVEKLKRYGVKPYQLTFYFLCGFNTTFEEDLHRFNILRELHVNPYCMVYNNRKDIPILNHFERWVNTHPPLYKVCNFKDYNGLSQKEIEIIPK